MISVKKSPLVRICGIVIISVYFWVVWISPSFTGTTGDVKKIIYEATNITEKTDQVLPQALLIGVKKCGTGAINHFLRINPNIAFYVGEVNFFDNDKKYALGLNWYRRKMPPSRPGQMTIEGSPRYFITENSAARVRTMNSSIKLLLMVKDPAERLISDYTHWREWHRNRRRAYPSFGDIVFTKSGEVDKEYIAVQEGLYAKHFSNWLKEFPRSQFHIIDGDNFVKNPLEELQAVEKFLGIPPKIIESDLYFDKKKGFFCKVKDGFPMCMVKEKGRKDIYPTVTQEQMNKIRDFYRPLNKEFFEQIGRHFPWP